MAALEGIRQRAQCEAPPNMVISVCARDNGSDGSEGIGSASPPPAGIGYRIVDDIIAGRRQERQVVGKAGTGNSGEEVIGRV